MHSFRIHVDGTVTWTLWHENLSMPKPTPKPTKVAEGATASSPEPSNRTQRSRARAATFAAQMQRARDFHVRSIFSKWRRAATPHPEPQLSTNVPSVTPGLSLTRT